MVVAPSEPIVPREKATESQYLLPKSIPFELRLNCAIYFEEQLFERAFNLLNNLLTSRPATATDEKISAFVPTVQQLALAATIAVHPSTTTRTNSAEKIQAANTALRLLHTTNHIVGPVFSRYDAAFTFRHYSPEDSTWQAWKGTSSSRTRSQGRGRHKEEDTALIDSEDTDLKHVPYACHMSIWSCGNDFWHVVGWAFNCAVSYPKRWERWQMWLDFMCSAMEDDWKERLRQAEQAESSQTADQSLKSDSLLRSSIIYRFVDRAEGGYGNFRRIVRAVFADGGKKSTNEFREVFRNELREPKLVDVDAILKRGKGVDVYKEEFGDYLENEDDESEYEKVRRPRRKATVASNVKPDLAEVEAEADVTLGNLEALALRKRLLQLLSTMVHRFPDDFGELIDLIRLYADFVCDLPLPLFQQFILPDTDATFNIDTLSSLCDVIAVKLIGEEAFPGTTIEWIDQSKLEAAYLSCAVQSGDAEDNARLSLCLESLLRMLATAEVLSPTEELRFVLETGIGARSEEVLAVNGELDGPAWDCLSESSERMIFLVQSLSFGS